MELELSEQQRLIQGSARDFLSATINGAAIRAARSDPSNAMRKWMAGLADLGWLGMRVPEEYGGSGRSFVDLLVLLEEMGRVVMPGSFFSTAVGAVEVLRECGDQRSREYLFPKIASGEAKVAIVLGTGGEELDPASIAVEAHATTGGFVLNGSARFVTDGHDADHLLCAARLDAPGSAEDSAKLFQMPARLPGLEVTPLTTVNGIVAARLVFNNVRVNEADVVAVTGMTWPGLERALLRTAVAKGAEMVGAASRVLEIAVTHAKQRQQFGRAIGSFQAIQHHCADMLTDLDGARWITYRVGWLIDEERATRRDMAMAKAWCSEAYRRIVQRGHQIMGGIGYCEDHDMPLFFRHARVAESSWGSRDALLNITAAELVAENAQGSVS